MINKKYLITFLFLFYTGKSFSVELILDTPWVSINDRLEVASSKLLVKKANGLIMASPFSQLLIKGDGWAKTFYQFEGHSVEFISSANSCFDIGITYRTGGNLLILKLFKVLQPHNIQGLSTDINIASNLGSIMIEGQTINAKNQVIVNTQRTQEITRYKIIETNDICKIEKVFVHTDKYKETFK